jgi:uncharacterized membrane protein
MPFFWYYKRKMKHDLDHRIQVIILLALGLAARWFMLDTGSLTIDEVGTLIIARQPLSQLLPFTQHLGFNPPLFNFFTALWQTGGESALWLRSLPFIFSVAALAAYQRFCAGFLPASTARLALFIAAFSPFWINLGQQFRMYSLFLFLSIAANHLFLRTMHASAGRGTYAAYGLTLLLGLHTHYYFCFVWAAQTATALIFSRTSRRRMLLCQAAAMLAFIPWLALSIKTFRVVSGVQSMDWSAPFYFLGNFILGFGTIDIFIHGWINAAGCLGLCALAAGMWKFRERYRLEMFLALLHIALPILSVPALEFLTGNSFTMPRYWIFMTPFYYMILAAAVENLNGWKRSAARITLMTAVLGALGAFYILKAKIDPFFAAAARGIAQSIQPGGLVLHTSAYWYMPMKYYYAPDRRHCLIASPREENGFLATGWLPDHCVIRTLADPALQAGSLLLLDPYRTVTGKLMSPVSRIELAKAKLLPD